MKRLSVFAMAVLLVGACGGADDTVQSAETGEPEDPGFQPPVLTNPEVPVTYPTELFESGVEGTVVLHLFVTEDGEVVTDSTRIAESSGNTTLDRAALEGVAAMTFAPALREGARVATPFLQPIHFRRPDNSGNLSEQ